jgi:homospermidine synthase
MLTTLILESANDADLDLLLHLAQRLGVKVTTTPSANTSDTEQARLLDEFAGSWQSEENGTELARQIREARYFRDRDVEL